MTPLRPILSLLPAAWRQLEFRRVFSWALVAVALAACGGGDLHQVEHKVGPGGNGDGRVALDRRAGGGDGPDMAVVFVEKDVAKKLAPARQPAPIRKAGEKQVQAEATGGGDGWEAPTLDDPVSPQNTPHGGGGDDGGGDLLDEDHHAKQDRIVLGGGDLVIDEIYWEELIEDYERIGPIYTAPGDLPYLRCLIHEEVIIEEYVDEYHLVPMEHGVLLPLEHTHVDAELVGPVARVRVEQTYRNPTPDVLEAVYVFPLPENAAVDGMRIKIGDRVIEGIIREREEARAIYEEAKAHGYVAALLEQERPNIFTQSVANIAPDAEIRVETQYVQDLTYDGGQYEFVFPMVVGPRYVPPNVPDAHLISPPMLGRGERNGHDISLAVRVDAGVRIHQFGVPTHGVVGGLDDGGRLALRLAEHDSIPNRDFVLRYDVAAEQPAVTVLSEMDDGQGWFTLMVQPPELDVDELIGTREFIFVVDVSGSMEGVPLEMSREAMEGLPSHLRPVDTFNIVTFANTTQQLFDGTRPANRENVDAALEFVGQLRSGGGTEILDGIDMALGAPADAGMRRAVVVISDGFVGNEDEVLSAVAAHVVALRDARVDARVFAFGVGSSTNRHLIDGLARFGDGTAEYALTREGPQRAVDAFLMLMDYPVLTDVEIDFGALDVDVQQTYPAHVPDLFASRPLVVHGRYDSAGAGEIVVRAKHKGEVVEFPLQIELSADVGHGGVIGTLWARSAVRALEREMLYTHDYSPIEDEITMLGLDYGIVTHYTSFVAVDQVQVGDGFPVRVDVGVRKPE